MYISFSEKETKDFNMNIKRIEAHLNVVKTNMAVAQKAIGGNKDFSKAYTMFLDELTKMKDLLQKMHIQL